MILREKVNALSLTRFEVKGLEIPESQPYSMMGGGPRWTHKEIAVLVQNRYDLDRASELLRRTRGACQKQLERLNLSISSTNEKKSSEVVIVFPQAQIDRRRTILKHGLSRLKKLLVKIDKAEDLAPKTINDLAKIVRATAALLNALEKWETGEEMLEIWKDEEDADQPVY